MPKAVLVRTYQSVLSAVLHPGIQVVTSHFPLRLDLLDQPLWIGDLDGSVPAVRLPCRGEPVPDASILHWAPVHTCRTNNRETHREGGHGCVGHVGIHLSKLAGNVNIIEVIYCLIKHNVG